VKHASTARLLLISTYREYTRDAGTINAAAIAFYTALSLVPIALLAVSVLRHLLGSSAAPLIGDLLRRLLPGSGQQVVAALQGQRLEGLGFVSAVSAVGLVWASSNLFAVLSRVLTTIWVGAPHRGFLAQRAIGLLSLIAAGLLFLANILITSVLAALSAAPPIAGPFSVVLRFFESSLPWLGIALLAYISFFLIYRFLPAGHVDAKAALLAAIPAALLWLLSRDLFSRLVAGSTAYNRFYGSFATAVVLLLWIYVSAIIMIVCAEFGEVLQERYWPARAEERQAGMI
jgi:membrane protein